MNNDKKILVKVLNNTRLRQEGLAVIESIANYLLTQDIKPVRHGEWKFDYYKGVYCCSLCNNINTPDKYCSCCGARMDNGDTNAES